MAVDPDLLGPIEREVRFFVDPFHWRDLLEGAFDPGDVRAWINLSLGEATERLRGGDDERFRSWVFDATFRAAIARAASSNDLEMKYADSGRHLEWSEDVHVVPEPSPSDAAGASWISTHVDPTYEGEAVKRRLRELRWGVTGSMAGDLLLVLEDPFRQDSRRAARPPERYRHYTNVQAARWINQYRTENRTQPLGSVLETDAVGPMLHVRQKSGAAIANHLRIARTACIARWLTRAENPGRERYAVQRTRKGGPPKTLVLDIVERLEAARQGGSRSAVVRHLRRAGFVLPGDLLRQ